MVALWGRVHFCGGMSDFGVRKLCGLSNVGVLRSPSRASVPLAKLTRSGAAAGKKPVRRAFWPSTLFVKLAKIRGSKPIG